VEEPTVDETTETKVDELFTEDTVEAPEPVVEHVEEEPATEEPAAEPAAEPATE